VKPGRTELVVRIPASERRIPIEVAGPEQPPIVAVTHNEVRRIAGKELLFVGHANLDGYDHTAVAKAGIDRLVKEARKDGRTVVLCQQGIPKLVHGRPHPDYAILSEGQEHQIQIEAERIIFAGGGFMACTLRNAQMTLHSMTKHNAATPIHFVFPAQAIWRGPVDGQPYPAPMVLLSAWFDHFAGDAQAYEQIVIPSLDRMIKEFSITLPIHRRRR
jgi:hypothetical protein